MRPCIPLQCKGLKEVTTLVERRVQGNPWLTRREMSFTGCRSSSCIWSSKGVLEGTLRRGASPPVVLQDEQSSISRQDALRLSEILLGEGRLQASQHAMPTARVLLEVLLRHIGGNGSEPTFRQGDRGHSCRFGQASAPTLAAWRRCSTSRIGGAPKRRLYSRLNCEASS